LWWALDPGFDPFSINGVSLDITYTQLLLRTNVTPCRWEFVYRVWERAESDEDDVVGVQDDGEYAGWDLFVCGVGLWEYGGDDDGGLGVLSAEC